MTHHIPGQTDQPQTSIILVTV